ncbi:hypothetical protein GCM10027422_47740 [Hymenobacter arcticus]
MSCSCSHYAPLTLTRPSITKRIKATKNLLGTLQLLAEDEHTALKLLACPHCGQYWQTGREWNFGHREYAFQVPVITVAEWLAQPYTQPAAWLIYGAVMGDYLAENTFAPGAAPCRVAGCQRLASQGMSLCKEHHIGQLQQFGILPKRPNGRLFAPY